MKRLTVTDLLRIFPGQKDEGRAVPRRNGVASSAFGRESVVDGARKPRIYCAQGSERRLFGQRSRRATGGRRLRPGERRLAFAGPLFALTSPHED